MKFNCRLIGLLFLSFFAFSSCEKEKEMTPVASGITFTECHESENEPDIDQTISGVAINNSAFRVVMQYIPLPCDLQQIGVFVDHIESNEYKINIYTASEPGQCFCKRDISFDTQYLVPAAEYTYRIYIHGEYYCGFRFTFPKSEIEIIPD